MLQQDRVCLDPAGKTCDKTYPILAVNQTENLSNVKASGIVGMAPKNVRGDFYPLFMNKIFNAGIIKNNMFSFYITNIFDKTQRGEESKITIGGYDL